jgi:hypothetical protein
MDNVRSLLGLTEETTEDSPTSTEEEEDNDDDEYDDESIDDETEVTYASCIAISFDDEEYAHRAWYTTLDGCQTCTCDNSNWNCTVEDRCLDEGADCEHEGEGFSVGEEFVSDDGCVTYSCEGVGYVAIYFNDDCCVYNEEIYPNGETFPSTDGCNTCRCTSGSVTCTMMLCP